MSSLFGGQQTSSTNTQNQNTVMFGQTSLFGQNAPAQTTPAFGQPSMGQAAPMFGQLGNNQSVFGQNPSSQSSMFGQTNPAQTTSAFGQTSGGLSAPTFGQGSSAAVFGQTGSGQPSSMFGQATGGQSNSVFGQGISVQSAPTFGQTNVQSTSTFGQATSGSVFGLATSGQTAPLFGQISSGQSVPSFGQSGPAFGQGTSSQSTPVFGQSPSSQSTSVFGQATSGSSAPTFGQASSVPSAPAFGQSSPGQSGFNFGQTASSQSATPFAQQSLGQTGSVFGLATSRQSSSLFGQTGNSQSVPAFGQTSTGQTGPTFGQGSTNQSSVFGQTATNISASHFAQVPSSQSTSLFAQATTNQSASFFTQPTTSQSASPFGTSGSVFGQATSGTSSTSRQPEDGSNQGSQSSGSRFSFGQTSSGQTPLFGLNTAGQTFGQTGSQSGQDGKGQISGFGQVNSGQSNVFGQPSGFQSAFTKQEAGSEFGQSQSALPSNSPFGIAQSSQIGKAETSEKRSVFGQQTNISGSVFGTNTQISTASSIVDSNFPTNMTSSPFTQVASNSEHSFKPPVHTTFKPILTGKSDETSSSSFSMSGKTESKDQSIFGSSTASSTSGNVNFFSLSPDKKNKVETSPSRPSFASANSSFTSFPEESRRDEGLKGVKRKEDHNRSPLRSDVATSDEPSSDLHSEHPPVKRSGRLNRDLRGGANLYVRSLFDVVKSQMKTQDRRDVKKEDNAAPKAPDSDSPPSNQSFGRNLSSNSPNQMESVKAISAPLSSQVAFTKPQMATTSQAPSNRMVSYVRPNQQGSVRDHSSAGTSEQTPGRIKPLLEEEELRQEIEGTSSMTATKQGKHPSSAEHLVPPVSPSELTAFYIKDLPNNQNKKAVLQDFFKKYGKIQRITCKAAQKIAFIQFNNHNCAAMAKRSVKKAEQRCCCFLAKEKSK